MKNQARMVVVLFFFMNSVINPETKDDICIAFNEVLKNNRKFLHYSFKDQAYIGRYQIDEKIPKLEKKISQLKKALKDKDALLEEQESLINSGHLMDSFDEKISALQKSLKARSQDQITVERKRLQAILMQKLNEVTMIYLEVSIGKYTQQREIKDLLKTADTIEKEIRAVQDQLLLPDKSLLKIAQQRIEKNVQLHQDEKSKLTNMKGNKVLMLEEASKNKKYLLSEYTKKIAKLKELRNDSKKLVKSMKLSFLKKILNALHLARQFNCSVRYEIES